jgi:hypothetical protein
VCLSETLSPGEKGFLLKILMLLKVQLTVAAHFAQEQFLEEDARSSTLKERPVFEFPRGNTKRED